MPEWAKTGPITAANYLHRAQAHCLAKSTDRHGTHPTLKLESPEFPLWYQYFHRHLAGCPWPFDALLRGKIKEMTIPEQVPMWFDPSFEPRSNYPIAPPEENGRPGRRHPAIPEGQDYFSLSAKHGRAGGVFEPGGYLSSKERAGK